jgi:membrane protein implicated in regulation of membrane protease activity
MIFILAVVVKMLWVEGPWGWVLVGVAAVIEIGESYLWIRWSRRRQVQVGAETLEGAEGIVITSCRPDGQIRVQGEIWAARCDESADPGDRVIVEVVDGLLLRVRRLSSSP